MSEEASRGLWPSLRILILLTIVGLSVVALFFVVNEKKAPDQAKPVLLNGPLGDNIRRVETAGTPLKAWVITVDGKEYLVVSHHNGLAVVPHKQERKPTE